MLQLLSDEGLVTSSESDGRRQYALTDAGREEAGRAGRPPWEEFAEGGGGDASIRDAGFQLGAAVVHAARTGSPEQISQVREALVDARRRIYAILGETAA